MNNFLHCYDVDTKKILIAQGYKLLKEDVESNIYIFMNNPKLKCFEDITEKVMFSNKLTF